MKLKRLGENKNLEKDFSRGRYSKDISGDI